jgi:hypothetical protein
MAMIQLKSDMLCMLRLLGSFTPFFGNGCSFELLHQPISGRWPIRFPETA